MEIQPIDLLSHREIQAGIIVEIILRHTEALLAIIPRVREQSVLHRREWAAIHHQVVVGLREAVADQEAGLEDQEDFNSINFTYKNA
jgi:hypothetical protein